jgi:gamma-glutamylcyclotransferase (GGCT)/AIG2-like uncharacterized protein YtfP
MNTKQSVLVAVYGAHRKGEPLHRVMSDATYLGTCKTREQRYRMRDGCAGLVALVTADGRKSVTVEVYRCSDETLTRVAASDGHPELCDRERVGTPYGTAVMFVQSPSQLFDILPNIASCDWSNRK